MTDNIYKLKILNKLVKISNKRQNSFIKAASNMRDARIKSLFYLKAKEVQMGLIELKKLIISLNGNDNYSIDIVEYSGRFWKSIINLMFGYNEIAIIDDIEYCELLAMNEYDKIVSLYLPPKVRILVLRLMSETQQNYDEIKAMSQSIKLMAN